MFPLREMKSGDGVSGELWLYCQQLSTGEGGVVGNVSGVLVLLAPVDEDRSVCMEALQYKR